MHSLVKYFVKRQDFILTGMGSIIPAILVFLFYHMDRRQFELWLLHQISSNFFWFIMGIYIIIFLSKNYVFKRNEKLYTWVTFQKEKENLQKHDLIKFFKEWKELVEIRPARIRKQGRRDMAKELVLEEIQAAENFVYSLIEDIVLNINRRDEYSSKEKIIRKIKTEFYIVRKSQKDFFLTELKPRFNKEIYADLVLDKYKDIFFSQVFYINTRLSRLQETSSSRFGTIFLVLEILYAEFKVYKEQFDDLINTMNGDIGDDVLFDGKEF